LISGKGDDNLDGFAGNDKLDGGLGDDILIGGLGADTYLISDSSNNGRDIIKDEDRDGKIFLDGEEISATAKVATNAQGQKIGNAWIMKHDDKDYYVTRVDTYNQTNVEGQNLLITPFLASNSDNSIVIENYDFVNGGYGITLSDGDAEFRVNSYLPGFQAFQNVATLSDGSFMFWNMDDSSRLSL
jgi:hypothetical protein